MQCHGGLDELISDRGVVSAVVINTVGRRRRLLDRVLHKEARAPAHQHSGAIESSGREGDSDFRRRLCAEIDTVLRHPQGLYIFQGLVCEPSGDGDTCWINRWRVVEF